MTSVKNRNPRTEATPPESAPDTARRATPFAADHLVGRCLLSYRSSSDAVPEPRVLMDAFETRLGRSTDLRDRVEVVPSLKVAADSWAAPEIRDACAVAARIQEPGTLGDAFEHLLAIGQCRCAILLALGPEVGSPALFSFGAGVLAALVPGQFTCHLDIIQLVESRRRLGSRACVDIETMLVHRTSELTGARTERCGSRSIELSWIVPKIVFVADEPAPA